MKEKEFISVIKNTLNSKYIGDDCAYLKDLGIVVTQDSLVEDVHFKTDFITPFQLGYKSVMVNISDVASSGAEPAYITVSLSLPNGIDAEFIKEFYEGCKSACGEGVEIVGGDITGGDKIFISICAIGKTMGRNISSRKTALIGQKIVVCGNHGSSGLALKLLLMGQNVPDKLSEAHLMPKAQVEFGQQVAQTVKEKYAMMDTSDGFMDALSTIANESGVLLEVNFDKIPHDKEIEQYENWQNFVLFGGEDYGIIAAVPQDCEIGTEIGQVKQGLGVDLFAGGKKIHFTKVDVENKVFNHWKENK